VEPDGAPGGFSEPYLPGFVRFALVACDGCIFRPCERRAERVADRLDRYVRSALLSPFEIHEFAIGN